MSKVNLNKLAEKAATVEDCISNIEYAVYDSQIDIVQELRHSWDLLYTLLLDLHEILCDLLGEIENEHTCNDQDQVKLSNNQPT